jgi:CBS domain containing-hemolysin-like protein
MWINLIAPIRWAIRGIADWITTRVVGEIKAADNILQVDEFLTLVEQVSEEGELDATERALIYNLLEANETEIVEVMTPRTQMAFLNIEMSVPEIIDKFVAYRHPRVPVFKTHRDNIVGFVHAEDILRLVLDDVDQSELTHEDIMHPPVVVPLTKKVDEMFDFFQVNEVRGRGLYYHARRAQFHLRGHQRRLEGDRRLLRREGLQHLRSARRYEAERL